MDNLETDLKNGLYSKKNAPDDPHRRVIGSSEIISERDRRTVACYPDTVVNNYVPFYFSVRTPMLLNIHSGWGVPQLHQRNIVYLCIPIVDLATDDLQWCFTDGNAAKRITSYYTSLNDINSIDWHSITTTDFKHDNADGDEDRIRKKHSEFLVKDYVPSNLIQEIVVYNESAKTNAEAIIKRLGVNIEPRIVNGFYF